MIRATPAAAAALRLLAKTVRAPAPPWPAVRLDPDRRGGLRMAVGLARPGDLVASDKDGPVLFLAAALTTPLDGLVFDQVDGGLTFRPTTAEEPDDLLVAVAAP